MRSGQSVVLLDETAGPPLYRAIALDQPLTKPAAPVPTKLTVAPGSIRVTVLNGTAVAKRAARAGDDLRGAGFRVQGTGNADATTYDRTVVRYTPGNEAAAATLAASLHGARTEAAPGAKNALTVIVGADYRTATAVKVSGSGTPAPRPSASASKPPVTAADDPCAA
jgi:hypothetical protein